MVMSIDVMRSGNLTTVRIHTEEIVRRLNMIGEKHAQGEFYARLGKELKPEWHPDDTDFSNSCDGWLTFVKEYLDIGNSEEQDAKRKAEELLKALANFVEEIEKKAVRYEFTVSVGD